MAVGNRNGVLTGESITLKVVVTDDSGCLRDTDVLPDVYIYDQSVDVDTIQAEIDAAIFTSALAGPLVPTLISTGFYEITYVVPSGSSEGTWHDVWVGTLDTVGVSAIQAFEVTVGADLSDQSLENNQMVVVELDALIANVSGTNSLGEDVILSFATTYNPFYASCELVRMEAGPWIGYLPEDTLALMIHWASREADCIAPNARCTKKFKEARARFVIYDAALKALTLPGGLYLSGLNAGAGDSKKLGELSITKGKDPSNITSGGVDLDTLKYIRGKREEWWRVVNAGGCIVPGEGLGPSYAVKGRFDPDKRLTGRLWESPDRYHYQVPTVNTRVRRVGQRRSRFAHHSHRPRHYGYSSGRYYG